jgi:hypothetical protein
MPLHLLDSNFFITAHRFHYPFDVVPSFWIRIQDLATKGVIGSIDKVSKEIRTGNDVLKDWIDNNLPSNFFVDSSVYIEEYAQLAQWAAGKAHHYSTAALSEFLDADEADAWLIATAMNGRQTVVTNEVSNPQMKARIAIPEPCNHFGVSFCNTITMFRNLGVTF